MPPIKKRMDQNLLDPDVNQLRSGLASYAVDNELTAQALEGEKNLSVDIVQYLAARHKEWKGLTNSVEWLSSTAHTHLKSTLKNWLRNKGKTIDPYIQAEIKERAA